MIAGQRASELVRHAVHVLYLHLFGLFRFVGLINCSSDLLLKNLYLVVRSAVSGHITQLGLCRIAGPSLCKSLATILFASPACNCRKGKVRKHVNERRHATAAFRAYPTAGKNASDGTAEECHVVQPGKAHHGRTACDYAGEEKIVFSGGAALERVDEQICADADRHGSREDRDHFLRRRVPYQFLAPDEEHCRTGKHGDVQCRYGVEELGPGAQVTKQVGAYDRNGPRRNDNC